MIGEDGRDGDTSSLWQVLTREIRSEDLAEIRQALAWLRRQMPGVLKVPPTLNFIPDANCILRELDFLCRRQREPGRTALQEVVDAGSARLFAPADLEVEVLENIPQLAVETKFVPDQYFAAWTEYKKRIHFFTLVTRRTIVLSDPDDVYLFDAIGVVGADAIISDDKVVLATGRAVKPTIVQGHLRRLTRQEAVRRTLALQGMMMLLLAGKGIEEIVRLCIRRPRVGVPALLGSAGILCLVDRWQMRTSGRSVVREFWGILKGEAGSILEALGELTRSAESSLAAVESTLGVRAPRSLGQFITAALISAGRPVPEPDLIEAIHAEGYDAWAGNRGEAESLDQWKSRCWQSFVSEVRQMLRTDPGILRTEHGWTSKLLPGISPVLVGSAGAPSASTAAVDSPAQSPEQRLARAAGRTREAKKHRPRGKSPRRTR